MTYRTQRDLARFRADRNTVNRRANKRRNTVNRRANKRASLKTIVFEIVFWALIAAFLAVVLFA